MRVRPRWAPPRTLRGRLIAGLVALLALACAAVGLVTYFVVQGALASELNNELQGSAGLATTCWNQHFTPASQGNSDNARQDGQSGQQGGQPTGDADQPQPSPSPSQPASATPHLPSASELSKCVGLGERTFVAITLHGQWVAAVIGDGTIALSAQDRKTLLTIPTRKLPKPGAWSLSDQVPTTTRYLNYAEGTFLLTAVQDPDGDGSVYITGLPLSTLHDTLRDVALAETVVFAAVLVLVGVLGTLWVRFSLRPLRRVASTASQVAATPLESGEVELPKGVLDTDPETETGQVGLAFNRMLGHVENALQRRAASEARLRRFAADASHELRTPLAAIRGYAELALLHPGDSPEQVTHAMGRVLSESTRMSVLVDDLLLLARLDAGRPLSREQVDMTRLAIDATSDAQVARSDHRWVLELPDDPVTVSGDEHRLHQVLANLLSNAGKHTPEGTTVTVALSEQLPTGEPGTGPGSARHGSIPPEPRLAVSVTDNGPGIPQDLIPDLFERFSRADAARSHAPDSASTGLGLAIVDAVVAAHHGAVLVTSRPGMTRFTFVLPRQPDLAGENGAGKGNGHGTASPAAIARRYRLRRAASRS